MALEYQERTAIASHEITKRAAELRVTQGKRGQAEELLKQYSLYPVEVRWQCDAQPCVL